MQSFAPTLTRRLSFARGNGRLVRDPRFGIVERALGGGGWAIEQGFSPVSGGNLGATEPPTIRVLPCAPAGVH